jgi:hypothetical protein
MSCAPPFAGCRAPVLGPGPGRCQLPRAPPPGAAAAAVAAQPSRLRRLGPDPELQTASGPRRPSCPCSCSSRLLPRHPSEAACARDGTSCTCWCLTSHPSRRAPPHRRRPRDCPRGERRPHRPHRPHHPVPPPSPPQRPRRRRPGRRRHHQGWRCGVATPAGACRCSPPCARCSSTCPVTHADDWRAVPAVCQPRRLITAAARCRYGCGWGSWDRS